MVPAGCCKEPLFQGSGRLSVPGRVLLWDLTANLSRQTSDLGSGWFSEAITQRLHWPSEQAARLCGYRAFSSTPSREERVAEQDAFCVLAQETYEKAATELPCLNSHCHSKRYEEETTRRRTGLGLHRDTHDPPPTPHATDRHRASPALARSRCCIDAHPGEGDQPIAARAIFTAHVTSLLVTAVLGAGRLRCVGGITSCSSSPRPSWPSSLRTVCVRGFRRRRVSSCFFVCGSV